MANSDWVEFEAENGEEEVYRMMVRKSSVELIAAARKNKNMTEMLIAGRKGVFFILLPYEKVCQALGFYK
jgi:hypothetical protein